MTNAKEDSIKKSENLSKKKENGGKRTIPHMKKETQTRNVVAKKTKTGKKETAKNPARLEKEEKPVMKRTNKPQNTRRKKKSKRSC